ncbi:putative transposase [Streptococcus lutetiensis 033]|uniref:Transposase n=1 Tax=Streptococcus lutetiensis 033 TaxID=1076934 RepID=A0AB33APQ5_9STRE|nr:putative transposase [Streptococcus lutetiensis 033]
MKIGKKPAEIARLLG